MQLASLQAFASLVGECDSCGHPGRAERDTTGAYAWILSKGHCTRGDCDPCKTDLLETVKRCVTGSAREIPGLDVDIYALPHAARLIVDADKIALALRIPPSAALKMLGTDVDRQLQIARDTWSRTVTLAANTLAQRELS